MLFAKNLHLRVDNLVRLNGLNLPTQAIFFSSHFGIQDNPIENFIALSKQGRALNVCLINEGGINKTGMHIALSSHTNVLWSKKDYQLTKKDHAFITV